MGVINKIKKGMAKKKKPNMPKDLEKKFRYWSPKEKKAAKLAERKVTIARLALIEKTPFFGRMTLLLQAEPDQFTPTMGTDGEYLFYNPHFVNEMMTQPQLIGTILHEVLHCALLHPWRKGKRNHFKWNMATDYCINQMVKEHNLQLPDGVLYDSQYDDMSADKVYEMLPDPKEIKISMKRQGKKMSKSGGDWMSDKSRWGKDRRDKKKEESKGSGKNKKKKGDKDKKDQKNAQGGGKGKKKDQQQQGKNKQGKGSGQSKSKQGKDKQKGNGSQKGNKQRQKDLQKKWGKQNKDLMDKLKKGKKKGKGQKLKDFWEGVFESAMRGTDVGHLPGYLKRVWKELQAKKDWKKLLANYLSVSTDDFNFSSPDRRFLNEDFMLPDLQTEENIEDVVIAIDTSGSISTWQFNHFMSEVKEILEVFPQFRGWLLQCDWELQDTFEIQPDKDFNPKFRGGGGTNFQPVFNKIEKEQWNPRVLIYLTDGHGYFPDEEPNYPVIWLIDSDVQPPFGERVQYEYDREDMNDI